MPPVTSPWQLVFGLSFWALWFIVIYSGIGIGCNIATEASMPDGPAWINLSLILITLATGAYLMWCAYRCRQVWRQYREREDSEPAASERYPHLFMASLATGVNFLAGLSILLGGLPMLLLAPCLR